MNTMQEFSFQLTAEFKHKALKWASQYDVCMLLDNNDAVNACGLHDIEFAVAAGVKHSLRCKTGSAFSELKSFADIFMKRKDEGKMIFGHLSYDLKNEIEKLTSTHIRRINFPDLHFFEPLHFMAIDKNGKFHGDIGLVDLINNTASDSISKPHKKVVMNEKVSREKYISNVKEIRQHIIEGDVYEMNYCVEFFSENAEIIPEDIYEKLKQKSPTPFSSFYKYNDQYLMCASPERFMKKQGNRLYSQPIKGTMKRGENEQEDEIQKQKLLNSEKERAENLMIVDLVRNDLARSSKTGSVHVDELFGIYSFRHVHQMISTVSSELRSDVHFVDAIKNAFPMGSMTGAPKIMAMQLTEKYENTTRGLYSGAVGYITKEGDFDFNVVIRSMQYNAATQYLSCEVGSAITYDSIPEQEYEECMLKAKAILEVLSGE